jgi:hypothetical protein
MLLVGVVCSMVACSSGGGGGGGGGGGRPAGTRSVSGTVTYDFVPSVYDPAAQVGTLRFDLAAQRPVRNAVVQVMNDTTVLATTTTDEAGHYALGYDDPGGTGVLQVVALAETAAPVIHVVDNTDSGAEWGIGAPLDASTTTMNLHATHGWLGTTYSATARTAAPFAILDSMYTASRAFLAVRTFTFPALVVNWSPNNVPASGNKALGQIGTSHYSPSENQIYILGKAGADTDEFDSHVIVHEWGHYFEHNLSRSDSPGGRHGGGDVLDPRLSFGEGYGNALASMLLPESIYSDTLWSGGSIVGFGFDAETNPADLGLTTDDPTPSAFSETSIMRLLYDLFDDSGASESYDTVAVGLGVIYDVLTGPEKTTQALTTIGSFIAGLKAHAGVNATAVNTLLAHYNIGPISDEWGTGDTLDTATGGLQAMYAHVTSFPTTTGLSLGGGFDYNKWEQNQYYVLTGNGSQVTVSATSSQDVALVVYQAGQQVAGADANTSGTETVHVNTTSGTTYVVNLVGFGATAGNYSVSLQFSSP